MNQTNPDKERGVNPYRPYVDFSVNNPALLNPYLPNGNVDIQSALSFTPKQEATDSWDLLSYAIMKYCTTAMASPFEVAHTLIQVQHLPTSFQVKPKEEKRYFDSDDSDEFDSDDEILKNTEGSEIQPNNNTRLNATDKLGYVVENEMEEGTRPTYQLPDLEGGLWNTMSIIIKHPKEGFFSLWKGQFTYWIYDILHLFLQPTIEGALNDSFDLYDDTIPLVHLDSAGPNIATMMVSNLVVGLLLNPLDLVRTRLIVQSSDPTVAKYNGPFHALMTIIQEEGIEALYYGADIIPSALYHVLSPLMQQCAPLIIDRWFHISPMDSPLIYSLVELALNTIELMIVLPLDTIRKRLQAQPKLKIATKKEFKTCIRTRKAPYIDAVDCAYRIVTEEAKPEPSRKGIMGATQLYQTHGFGALYRGFAFHSTTIVCTSLVSSVLGVKGDPEW